MWQLFCCCCVGFLLIWKLVFWVFFMLTVDLWERKINNGNNAFNCFAGLPLGVAEWPYQVTNLQTAGFVSYTGWQPGVCSNNHITITESRRCKSENCSALRQILEEEKHHRADLKTMLLSPCWLTVGQYKMILDWYLPLYIFTLKKKIFIFSVHSFFIILFNLVSMN